MLKNSLSKNFNPFRVKKRYSLIAFFILLGTFCFNTWIPDDQRFHWIPMRMGDFYYQQELFYGESQADIVVFGSSTTWQSFDSVALMDELKKMNVSTEAYTVASNWRGEDFLYFQLRNYLKVKSPKLVVMSTPSGSSQAPHPASKYLMQPLTDYPLIKKLSWKHQLGFLAESFLSFPKLLLSYFPIKASQPNPRYKRYKVIENRGYLRKDLHYRTYGENSIKIEFKKDTRKPTLYSSDQMIYRRERSGWFNVKRSPEKFNPFEKVFFEAIVELCKEKKIPLVLLQFPYPEKDDWNVVELREDVVLLGLPVIGIPLAKLYPGWSKNEVLNHFENGTHMNSNGGPYFTRSVAPAIREFLEN